MGDRSGITHCGSPARPAPWSQTTSLSRVRFKRPLERCSAGRHVASDIYFLAESPTLVGSREPQQPVSNHGILRIQFRPIVVTGLTHAHTQACKPDADTSAFDNFSSHLTALRWLQYFPSMTSWRISALSFSSAYIFFSRRFSSSSSFIRFISEASMPPNLDRHL